MSPEEKEFWKESYEAVIRLDDEANKTSRALSAQLITFSTLMITLTTFFLGQGNIVSRLNLYQKGFLIAGLTVLLLSIGFGIAEYFIVKNYYKKSGMKYLEMVDQAPPKASIAELRQHRSKTLASLPPESNPIMLYLQVGTIGVGVVLYFILLLTILY